MRYWKLGFSQRRPLPKLSGTAINGINRAVNKIHKASWRYQNKKHLQKKIHMWDSWESLQGIEVLIWLLL